MLQKVKIGFPFTEKNIIVFLSQKVVTLNDTHKLTIVESKTKTTK